MFQNAQSMLNGSMYTCLYLAGYGTNMVLDIIIIVTDITIRISKGTDNFNVPDNIPAGLRCIALAYLQ